MKLSENTLSLLKNFSNINGNLVIKEGDEILTISDKKNIMAHSKVDESFDQSFGIYDLNEFLGAYSLIEDPTLNFDEESVTISSGVSSIIYRFSDPSILTSPERTIGLPSVDVNLKMTHNMIEKVRRAGSVLGAPVLSITNKDTSGNGSGIIRIRVFDPSNPTANVYEIEVGDIDDSSSFDFQFLIENIKVIPDDYDLKISSKKISEWDGINNKVKYWIALEKDSSYAS